MREIVKWVVDVYTSVRSFIFGEPQKENEVIFKPEKIALVFFDMDEEEEEEMEEKTLMTFTSTKDGELFDLEVSEEEIRRIEEEGEIRRKKIDEIEKEVEKILDEEERVNGKLLWKTKISKRQKLRGERIRNARIYFCDKCKFPFPREDQLVKHFKTLKHRRM